MQQAPQRMTHHPDHRAMRACIRQHTSADDSSPRPLCDARLHTSAYVSVRQHTSADDSSPRPLCDARLLLARQLCVSICTTSAVVSKYFGTSKARRVLLARHMPAYVSICQHTSADDSSGTSKARRVLLARQSSREHALSGLGDESSADVCWHMLTYAAGASQLSGARSQRPGG
jgi:hypothetical protein